MALSTFENRLEVETVIEIPDALKMDHIYSSFLQVENHKKPGQYESFVCAIRYDDLSATGDLSSSTFRYSTCDDKKYSDIVTGNFKAYQV